MARDKRSLKSWLSNSQAARLPSYLSGSWAQSLACYDPPRQYKQQGGPAIVLIPGLFCTPSVMNRLGDELEQLGADVFLPPRAYPIPYGVLANICHLDHAAKLLLQDLVALRWKRGVKSVTLAGHSNGGLIALLALEQAGLSPLEGLPEIAGVVTMACPFKGAPAACLFAPAIPACKDIRAGSPVLDRTSIQAWRVRRALVSGFDFLVPESSQSLPGMDRVLMAGYQHMDFIVGTKEKVRQTAERIVETMEAEDSACAEVMETMDSACVEV